MQYGACIGLVMDDPSRGRACVTTTIGLVFFLSGGLWWWAASRV